MHTCNPHIASTICLLSALRLAFCCNRHRKSNSDTQASEISAKFKLQISTMAALECLNALVQATAGLGQGTSVDEVEAATAKALTILRSQQPSPGSTPGHAAAAAAALWNASLDIMAQEPADARDIARIQQCASDVMALVPLESLSVSDKVSAIDIFHKTGRSWAGLQQYEAADAAFAKGLENVPWLQDICFATRNWGSLEQRCGALYFGLLLDRMQAGWQLNQQMLVSALTAQAKEFACDERLPSREGAAFKLELVEQLKTQGQGLLQEDKAEHANPLLSLAYEVLTALGADSAELELEGLEVQDMVCKVLTLLVHSYSKIPGQEDLALGCIQALQQADPQASNGVTVPFLLHAVLLQLGRNDEAETELLNLISHEEATPEMCLAALITALASGAGGVQAAKSAVPIAMERFPEDSALVLGLTGALGCQPSASEELEGLILDVAGDDRVLEALREEPEASTKLHGQLWNHAMKLLEGQYFERALRFFAASLPAVEAVERRVAGLHAKALCCIGMRDFGRALNYVADAEEALPKTLGTGFLRLRVSLAAQDAGGAAAAAVHLAGCEDATPDVLRVACIEAQDSGMPSVAKQVLLMLLDTVLTGSTEQYVNGYEATLFQNLIKLVQDSAPSSSKPPGPPAAMEVDGAGEAAPDQPPPAPHTAELAKYFDMAAKRMKAVGPSKFFHAEDGKPMQQEWFALTAWSAACEASRSGQMQQAAVLMGNSGEFWEVHPQPSQSTLSKQKAAFLFAGAAALDVYDDNPEFETALALAAKYLSSAKSTAATLQRALPLGAALDAKADTFLLLLEFSLAARQHDPKAQLDVIERAKALPAFSAGHFAKMAAMCKDGKLKSLDMCKAAEQAALQRLTSEASLNYQAVAATLRSLVELSRADADKLQLLSEGRSILKNAPRGSFPEVEAAWLITTAFNRGCLHARCWRMGEALEFMQLALDMLPTCPSLAAHKEDMEREYEAASNAKTPLQAPEPGARQRC